MTTTERPDDDRYGTQFLHHRAPDTHLPERGMPAVDAMRLVDEELVLEGDPWRNLVWQWWLGPWDPTGIGRLVWLPMRVPEAVHALVAG